MFMNKPIISSDCISLKRILTETDAGFIYRNDSPSELTSLLEMLLSNRKLLEEKGMNGRKAILEKLNWNIDKQRLVLAYNNLEQKQ
jgi:glycosyltransferase involved in cell wall biosynthesis